LEQTGKMVIIFDGFEKISPDYSSGVRMLIRSVREKNPSGIGFNVVSLAGSNWRIL
jgi:hypothetical protein